MFFNMFQFSYIQLFSSLKRFGRMLCCDEVIYKHKEVYSELCKLEHVRKKVEFVWGHRRVSTASKLIATDPSQNLYLIPRRVS